MELSGDPSSPTGTARSNEPPAIEEANSPELQQESPGFEFEAAPPSKLRQEVVIERKEEDEEEAAAATSASESREDVVLEQASGASFPAREEGGGSSEAAPAHEEGEAEGEVVLEQGEPMAEVLPSPSVLELHEEMGEVATDSRTREESGGAKLPSSLASRQPAMEAADSPSALESQEEPAKEAAESSSWDEPACTQLPSSSVSRHPGQEAAHSPAACESQKELTEEAESPSWDISAGMQSPSPSVLPQPGQEAAHSPLALESPEKPAKEVAESTPWDEPGGTQSPSPSVSRQPAEEAAESPKTEQLATTEAQWAAASQQHEIEVAESPSVSEPQEDLEKMAPLVAPESPAQEELGSTESPLGSAPPSPSPSWTAPQSPLANIRQKVRHVRSSSFQRLRKQMQRAWRWGPIGSGGGGGGDRSPREQLLRTTVNIEAMANQKRQWYRINSKARDHKQYKEPSSLFEHFFIIGLHSYANVEVIEDAFAKKKAWESDVARSEIIDLRKIQYHGPIPTMEPQILFKYPPVKRVEIRESDLPAFCFPEGVKARLIERTPSMSDLNEVIFGQEHLARDDLAFVFCVKVSDNAPLYGVCLHVQEIVQRAPGILGTISPLNHSSYKPSRFLVSAPRCYCLLTRVPFFELHYEMLNSIIAQERLDRITQFASEMAMAEPVPRSLEENDQVDRGFDSSNRLSYNGWMECAIPVSSVSGLISSAGLASERDAPSFLFRSWEPHSPQSACASEASDFSYVKELEKEARQGLQQYDDCMSETSGSRCDSFGRVIGTFENGNTSPDLAAMNSPVCRRLERVESTESLRSSVKCAGSDEEEELNLKHDMFVDDEKVMEWAKVHNNGPLQIVCGYHALPLPPRGCEIVFHPLEHLQPVKYSRPGVSVLGLDDTLLKNDLTSAEMNEVNAQLAAAEEALSLSIWTSATICRALSLESVLALFAGVLLEKQVVVICPNLGVLSAIVLSIVPMIRPFEWQSLLLPVLPRKLIEFLDAPVPFIVGVQYKPPDIKMKTSNLVRINVHKDQVKACSLPQLPRYKELISDLSPIHARLSCENALAKRHPVYRCNEIQAEAARQFLNVMRCYLESLCSDLRSHTITNVQSNNDRVSLLLKDSFIDSFAVRDRPFMKLFVETQMFSVLSDLRLSRFENEQI